MFVYADVRSGCMDEGGPAGVDSTLTFENSDNMMELPIINYDQKQVWNGPLPSRLSPLRQNDSPRKAIRMRFTCPLIFVWVKLTTFDGMILHEDSFWGRTKRNSKMACQKIELINDNLSHFGHIQKYLQIQGNLKIVVY